MNTRNLFRATALAATFVLTGVAAHAEGDIYSRLAAMHEKLMKPSDSSMVTKDEYLKYVGTAWDMKAAEMHAKDGKLTQAHLKDLEALLGRMVGAK